MAKGQVCHWYDAVGVNAGLYHKGAPVIFTLDQALHPVGSHIVSSLHDFPAIDGVGYEDFRLFRYEGEIWVNHSLITIVRRHACASTFQAAKTCLSRLDPTATELTFLGHPQVDFPLNRMEKNWLYLEHHGNLYLFYSFHPYRVLQLTDRKSLSFATRINQLLPPRLADIGGFGTLVSYSTNPIDYDAEHWLLLIHQVEPGQLERCYHHWGVLIGKESLLPQKISARPLFSGQGARGRKPGIIYVASVIKRASDFVFFLGEGDAYVTQMVLSQASLERSWVAAEFEPETV